MYCCPGNGFFISVCCVSIISLLSSCRRNEPKIWNRSSLILLRFSQLPKGIAKEKCFKAKENSPWSVSDFWRVWQKWGNRIKEGTEVRDNGEATARPLKGLYDLIMCLLKPKLVLLILSYLILPHKRRSTLKHENNWT